MTFDQICQIDRRVAALRKSVEGMTEGQFLRQAKPYISDLVGMFADPHPGYDNRSVYAYEAVYFGLMRLCK